MTHFYPWLMTVVLLCGPSIMFAMWLTLQVKNRTIYSLKRTVTLLSWERDTAERQLRIAESAIRYHEAKYEKDIAYWKAKDKRTRARAWRAEQIAIEKSKRIRGLSDMVKALTGHEPEL